MDSRQSLIRPLEVCVVVLESLTSYAKNSAEHNDFEIDEELARI